MLFHYWKIGNYILYHQNLQGWGSKIIKQLAKAIRLNYPEKKGYSERNLTYMCPVSYTHLNEILVIGGKSTVRTVYTVPQFTIPDDKILVIELVEKNGGRHQTIRVENSDIVAAKVINELKIK